MEMHFGVAVTKREADAYLQIVNLALRGDLQGVQRLVRSSPGRALFEVMREASAYSERVDT